jgi:hypothetical protein
MVNRLLTVSIKVKIPAAAESQYDRGLTMKKNSAARWSFWNWMLGSGQGNGGSSG